jgi:hypothetical protein
MLNAVSHQNTQHIVLFLNDIVTVLPDMCIVFQAGNLPALQDI